MEYLNGNKWFPKSQKNAIGIFVIVAIVSAIAIYYSLFQFSHSHEFEILWIAGVGFVFLYAVIKWFESWYKHYKEHKKQQIDYNEAEEIKAESKSKKGIIIMGIVLAVLALIRLLYYVVT